MIATMTKEQELLDWCKQKKLFSYVDVLNWKPNHYYLRADRTIRDFVKEGLLRRIPDAEAILRGLRKVGRASIAWFETV